MFQLRGSSRPGRVQQGGNEWSPRSRKSRTGPNPGRTEGKHKKFQKAEARGGRPSRRIDKPAHKKVISDVASYPNAKGSRARRERWESKAISGENPQLVDNKRERFPERESTAHISKDGMR